MLQNLNDSKSHFFTWVIVTAVILIGGIIGMAYLIRTSEEEVLMWEKLVFGIALPYVVATIPIGWCFRRRVLHGYIHVPTERIKVFETNLALALCRLLLCEIIAVIDLLILLFYIVFAIVTGPFFFIYFIISGIIFLSKKLI